MSPELAEASDELHLSPASVPVTPSSNGAEARKSVVDELAAHMFQRGESFWTAIYPMFMSRDLTRDDVRKIVQIGLENTNGNYRLLVQLFNMPDGDYKRFLSFLRKHVRRMGALLLYIVSQFFA